MAGNIRLEVVTPEKVVVSEEAQIVVAPGTLGEFGVLIGHTPFMTTLKTGTLRYTDTKGTDRSVFVSGGFAEALPNKVSVLAESAERRRDIDVERATAALERAQKRLAAERAGGDIDFVRAKAALERALARLKLAKTPSQ
ncbi:MAG: F0F1 ATP synthase subunit epsilon [Desulfobacterales bacterium]|nr:MAG: F0F1 ATP synthase subunit epsilon [Desulfobacterales bacterium]